MSSWTQSSASTKRASNNYTKCRYSHNKYILRILKVLIVVGLYVKTFNFFGLGTFFSTVGGFSENIDKFGEITLNTCQTCFVGLGKMFTTKGENEPPRQQEFIILEMACTV